jgi:hypothetical protein
MKRAFERSGKKTTFPLSESFLYQYLCKFLSSKAHEIIGWLGPACERIQKWSSWVSPGLRTPI